MIFFEALQSILSIAILVAIGYIIMAIGWFDQRMAKAISKLVVNISLPGLMVHNLVTSFDKEMLFGSAKGLFLPFASIGLLYLVSYLISGFVVEEEKRGTFEAMFTFSNTVFIGLPVNLLLFGEASVPYSLLYYVANTLYFWTIGVVRMGRSRGKDKETSPWPAIRKALLAPPFLGFGVGIIVILLELNLPVFLTDTARYLGNMTTPLSLMFIGMTFHSINLKAVKFSKDQFWIFMGRFILSPLIVFGLTLLLPIPTLMRNVFIIQASMPIMAQVAIVSDTYGGDHHYATLMVGLTTLASIIMIPIYMVLLSSL